MSAQILTEEHFSDINLALQALDSINEVFTRAKQAGIDLSAQEAQATDARTKLTRIKNAFFPGR